MIFALGNASAKMRIAGAPSAISAEVGVRLLRWFPGLKGCNWTAFQSTVFRLSRVCRASSTRGGRWFGEREIPLGEPTVDFRYARNHPLDQKPFTGERDPAARTTLVSWCFAAKDEFRCDRQMLFQPGQTCFRCILRQVIGQSVFPRVEQASDPAMQGFGKMRPQSQCTTSAMSCFFSETIALSASIRFLPFATSF